MFARILRLGLGGLVVFLIIATTVGLAGYVLYVEAFRLLEPVSAEGEPIEISVRPGATTVEVARQLKAEGIIRHAGAFVVMARWQGVDGQVKSGDYLLTPTEDLETILDKLVRGEVRLFSFTIPEGLTLEQIGDLLVARGLATEQEFQDAVTDSGFICSLLLAEEISSDITHPMEGYLFPDTYRISRDYQTVDIIRLLRNRSDDLWADLAPRADELGMTRHEVLTLASIIEKEARIADERSLISGVFHNRLAIGMKLEADPTVKYVLPGTAEILTYDDIAVDSPYNTYLYPGLPPGPICNPGLDSIRAALHPDDTEYLFFVADVDGSHVFSRTYSEHEAARRRIQGR